MKQQFIEPLKVGGIMVMILSPALAVAGLIWEQHLHYLDSLESHSSSIWIAVHSRSAQPLLSPEYLPESILRILCCVLLWLPFSLSLGICLHNSYHNYRAAILRHQVAYLGS
jgi:hypothetical protein